LGQLAVKQPMADVVEMIKVDDVVVRAGRGIPQLQQRLGSVITNGFFGPIVWLARARCYDDSQRGVPTADFLNAKR
jgi:hypothetical protein